MTELNGTHESRELQLKRIINAPPEKLFRAWTEPSLLKQCFQLDELVSTL